MAKVYGGMRAGHEHKFCFSATFLSELLRTGLGVEEDAPIPMLGDMGDVEIDWALGLVLSRAQRPRAAALGPAKSVSKETYYSVKRDLLQRPRAAALGPANLHSRGLLRVDAIHCTGNRSLLTRT